jgi:hypothetical protein
MCNPFLDAGSVTPGSRIRNAKKAPVAGPA